MTNKSLKKLLDNLYTKYNHKFSDDDPVWLLHNLNSEADIELFGFIISCYSYGRVKQIINYSRKFLELIGERVFEFISNFDRVNDEKYCQGFYYRFNNRGDFIELISVLKKTISVYGSLKKLFLSGYNPKEITVFSALNNFSKIINSFSNRNNSFRYLIAIPENNSTCKRLNLFLRWMVRKDNVDLGLWGKEISKSKLIIPVDIHVYRQVQRLKLIDRKSCDMKFALLLTEKLRSLDPCDPVKYDFSLCHLGIESSIKKIINNLVV